MTRALQSPAGTLMLILAVAFVAPVISSSLKRVRLPALVLEILGGILLGPAVLGLVKVTEPIQLVADLGLATLIFLAGFEIDPARIRGRPIRLALGGWVASILIGLAAAGALWALGIIETELYVAFALTSTALGTLLPIVRDAGLLSTNYGSHLLAIGTVGEFGPIIAVALVLSGASPTTAVEALLAFVAIAVAALVLTARLRPGRFHRVLAATIHSSGQLHVRLALVLILAMTFLAYELGLDFLLGAFTAGVLYRLVLSAGFDEHQVEVVEGKVEAVSFGLLVPIFFVVTGIQFDLDSLISSPAAMAEVPLFLGLFLLARGLPLLAYRRDLPNARDRWSLAFLSATGLPLIVAITTLGVAADLMKSSTAAALVGAGMLSVVIYPMIGLRLAPPAEAGAPSPEPEEEQDPA